MNYLLSALFAVAGVSILIWNKPLSEKFGVFYSRRFASTFGTLAHILGWDDPNRPFNKFMHRGFVLTAGIILLIFALAAFTGTNFAGPSANSLLSVPN
jgi:hypothetical protein